MSTTTQTRNPGLRGRRSPSHAPALHLRKFAPAPSTPPSKGDVSAGITDWGMLGNDRHSDCGAAAFQHGRMAKSGINQLDADGTGLPADSPQATDYTLTSYYAYGRSLGETGRDPDQGVENSSWLKFLFDQGAIAGYAELDASNADEVHMAMLNFHGVLLGCDLTDDAEDRFKAHEPWTITPQDQPDPHEGHDIYLVAYDTEAATETIVTWGACQACTVAWDSGEALAGDLEAWVFITAEDAARNDVDLDALQAAIRSLGGTTE